jgi:hypothetical protein
VAVHPQHGVWFFELKSDTGRVSAAQEEWLLALFVAGASCEVLRPRDWDRCCAIARGEA